MSDTDLPRDHENKLAAEKRVRVILQDGIEMLDLCLKAGSGKSKRDDAATGETFPENQLAEVPIGDEQNAFFLRAIARTSSSARPGGHSRETAGTS